MESLPHNIGNPTFSRNSPVTHAARKEYLYEIKERYYFSSRKEKAVILDEFCRVCEFNRKYAIRILNAPTKKQNNTEQSKHGRPQIYHTQAVVDVLLKIWEASNLICSKRIKAMLPLWLPWYEQSFTMELTADTKQLLENISAPTIDRIIQPHRKEHGRIGLATTKPGSLLKKHIPIKTNQWDESRPGFLEADTVAHCGTSVAGSFVYTVNTVDIATGWTVQRAVWGKGETGVFHALQNIEETLPFPIRGFDSDNGNEFINHHLLKYFTHRKQPVNFTRSREYHKNDNAHIEGKNWTHVRQYLGYRRFDHDDYVHLMNDLYTTEWYLLLNFFLPSVKLIEKYRDKSKLVKHHDAPLTPLQRVLNAKGIKRTTKAQLRELFASLNPFKLQQAMKKKIDRIHQFRPPNSSDSSEEIQSTTSSLSINNQLVSPSPFSLRRITPVITQ